MKSVQFEPSCSMRTDGWTHRQTDMTKLIAFAVLRTRLKLFASKTHKLATFWFQRNP